MTPARPGRDRVRVCALGAYFHRQPLAYPPITAQCRDTIQLVDDPERADIIVVAHTIDLENLAPRLTRLLATRPGRRLVMLSEEPFWDTVWGADPFARWQDHPGPEGPLPFVVVNFQTSPVFAFDRIPYLMLTDPRYIEHYRPLFARNAGLARADWRRHFAQTRWDAAFVAAKRRDARYRVSFPEHDVEGLCGFRYILNTKCRARNILRMGEGWVEGPPRQALSDWHLDKLDQLDMKVRYVSALENTHQATYVSEKIVDAFAVGAIPIYMAGPTHRVRRLVPDGSWANVYGFEPSEGFDAEQEPTDEMLDAYVEAQRGLHLLFSDPRSLASELDRFASDLTDELAALAG